MNNPHKVYFVDSYGKNRYDVLGSRNLAILYAKAYSKAGYKNIVVYDIYHNLEIKF